MSPPTITGSWSIAIHGGAGEIDRSAPADLQQAYRESLSRALAVGRDALADGAAALDVVELTVRTLEEDPLFNSGRGAAFDALGGHELDASIMDGATLACGAVAGVRTVRNPVRLARQVLERSGHVLLVGSGAEAFADALGPDLIERVANTWFDTDMRRVELERRQAAGAAPGLFAAAPWRGTVGTVVRDREGRLAAATSTGGLTGKRYGRVGDTPLIGAGTYANGLVAVSCTGIGEEFIRHGIARDVAARVQHASASLRAAADAVIRTVLRPGSGGLIAVDALGQIVVSFNTEAMYRGAATSAGRFEVGLFPGECQ
jgi:L-asparaginase / beta-aspartyl-peptidase